jgi:cobalt-zinc-cadmium resistance protein CzcA
MLWLFLLPIVKEKYKDDYAWLESLPTLGREFMPELEEGNLYIRGTFPVNINLEDAVAKAELARRIMRQYPEVELIQSQVGRPDDGTDPTGFYNVEFTVPLKPEKEWPLVKETAGWRSLLSRTRTRTKSELIDEMRGELTRTIFGVDWNFSQYIRDNVMESLSGVKGDNSVKIIGPDLDKLEEVADQVAAKLGQIRGVTDVGVFRIKGQANLELGINRRACERWGIPVTDVENVINVVRGNRTALRMRRAATFGREPRRFIASRAND